MQRNFSDGSQDAYAELPVKVTGLGWRRGNSQLSALKETDPAQYFGGWRGFVNDKDGNPNPVLPLPVITRESDNGKSFQVYAAPYIIFLPIQHRTRFELRVKVKDEQTGQERNKVVSVSKKFIKGYEPHRQIFGMVFSRTNPDETGLALLYIDKWSSFISIEKAGEKWNKVKPQPNTAIVRRYGTMGKMVDGKYVPNFETRGESKSTPIEAIGLDKPTFYVISDALNDLYDRSLDWRNCTRWNAVGEVTEKEVTPLELFAARAKELNLTDEEIGQIIAENGNDYAKALESIQAIPEEPQGEENEFPY